MRYRYKGFVRLACALVTTVVFAGCVMTKLPETSVDRAARAPELPNAPYEKVLIIGIAARGATAREFEEELALDLSNKRTQAFGYRRAAQRADIQEDVVRSIVAEENADAIVVVSARLVDAEQVKTEEHVDVNARPIGGSLVDFFRYDYEEYTVPARTGYQLKVQFNTDMFDTETEKRIYTVTSSGDMAETSSEVIVAESREISARMRKDGMVR